MVRTNKGFTLVELMVVIVIIGILAALAIPKFTAASDKAKWSEVPSVMASYENAQLARLAETNLIGAMADLVFDAPAQSKWFTYGPSAAAATGGVYRGYVTGAATASIGGITGGSGVQTTVAPNAAITHARYGTGASDANISKMMGNFLSTGSSGS